MYISFVASPLMKNAFFASLDEINGIFIPKILISSIYFYVIIPTKTGSLKLEVGLFNCSFKIKKQTLGFL